MCVDWVLESQLEEKGKEKVNSVVIVVVVVVVVVGGGVAHRLCVWLFWLLFVDVAISHESQD